MADRFSAIPPSVRAYRVPPAVLVSTAALLRDLSAGRREAVVLWQGQVVDAATAQVTKVIVPIQSTSDRHFDVPLNERLRLAQAVSAESEFILVQLHTHPHEAYHSKADDAMAFTKHTGAISIVVPDFGRGWTGDFLATSVNIHLGAGHWRELSSVEVAALLEVVP
jgi:hypothetical protein